MKEDLSVDAAEALFSQLPGLRERFGSAIDSRAGFGAASELMDVYLRLGLVERACDWLRVATELPEEGVPGPSLFRHHTGASLVWLNLGDGTASARSLERAKAWGPGALEDERTSLEAQVLWGLSFEPGDAFAPLERAFRHLRHHPSPLWSSRFFGHKARWQASQGRTDEALVSWKRSRTEALRSGVLARELAADLDWAAVAPRGKALKMAASVLSRADEARFPRLRLRALELLALPGGSQKEADTVRALRACLDLERELSNQSVAWDRACRDADRKTLSTVTEERQRSDAAQLAAIASHLAAEVDLERCIDVLYPAMRSLVAADIFGIALWVPEKQALDYSLFIEEGRRTRVGLIPVDSTRSLGAWCFRENRPVRVNDIDREYAPYLKELSRLSDHQPKSMMFHPLRCDRKVLGIVTVQAFARGAYGPAAEAHLAVVASCLGLRLQGLARPET